MPGPVWTANMGLQTLSELRQRIGEEQLNAAAGTWRASVWLRQRYA
jgi:hypothetical protein